MKLLLLFFAALLGGTTLSAHEIKIKVNASQRIATSSPLFNGTNIEDINNQTNGGVFGQLLHGEAFEENIETDFLNLDRSDYSKIYIMSRYCPSFFSTGSYFTDGGHRLV